MSSNYHTPIAGGAALAVATINSPLGQLDSTLSAFLAGTQGITQLNFGEDTTLTIATVSSLGTVTKTQSRHLIDTEAAAASDDLDTISGGNEGDLILLQIANSARVVTIKHNTGNIYLRAKTDLLLNDTRVVLTLLWDGVRWVEVGGYRINTGYDSTVTIAGGIVTASRPRHLVDTEGAAATDDLDTITGGNEGDILFLEIVNSSRNVVIKHNTGNIFTRTGQDVRLTSTNQAFVCYWNDSRWVEFGKSPLVLEESLSSTLTPVGNITLPRGTRKDTGGGEARLAVKPSYEGRSGWEVKAAAALMVANGIALPTSSGSLASVNQTDTNYLRHQTTAAGGATAGIISTTFNLVRRTYNPFWGVIIRTADAADILTDRIWVGLCSAAPGNVDTIAGATEFAGFRWSTVAGDAGFVPVTKDATTQNVGTPIGTVATNTRYLLTLEFDNSNGVVYFRVNDSAAQAVTLNLPQAATELGFVVLLTTTVATAKNWYISRSWCDHD